MERSTIYEILVFAFISFAIIWGLWHTGKRLFMSRVNFENVLEGQSRYTRLLFPNHKPNIFLMRTIYFIGFIVYLILTIVLISMIITFLSNVF